jgi:hypothetical protein
MLDVCKPIEISQKNIELQPVLLIKQCSLFVKKGEDIILVGLLINQGIDT